MPDKSGSRKADRVGIKPFKHLIMTTIARFQEAPQAAQIVLFEKRTVMELSVHEMEQVDGGTSAGCGIAAFAALVAIGRAGYEFGSWLAYNIP
jgi:hypothetical protein